MALENELQTPEDHIDFFVDDIKHQFIDAMGVTAIRSSQVETAIEILAAKMFNLAERIRELERLVG